jgi:hypothetical protein
MVFLGHLGDDPRAGFAHALPYLGSDGVVIFFVLSGYVIAYSAMERDRSFQTYAISRCARVYSVVVPAVALTVALEWAGVRWFPGDYDQVYDRYQFAKLWQYLVLWLTFTSEIWGLNESVFFNSPYWSMCFEVWYYVAFAAMVFLRGWRRLAAVTLVALVAGPKICVLFPLWGLGAACYFVQRRVDLAPVAGRALLALGLAGYLAIKASGSDGAVADSVDAWLGGWPVRHLQMAWHFPGWALIAASVAASILGMRFSGLAPAGGLARPVATLASFTFSLYLVHMPLLRFFSVAAGPFVETLYWPAIATLAAVGVFASISEHRVGAWRRGLSACVQMGGSIAVAVGAAPRSEREASRADGHP